jgi:outer membrane protein assembly factor BamE (lipoprotein component of BamABCDE complex)
MFTLLKTLLPLSLLIITVGCAQYSDKRGVEVTWQPDAMENMQKGETTRREVLTLFGPPSQVISMGDETVLYYLYEKTAGEGLILIVYNRFDVQTKYDRAVFFFDENDLLTEYSSQISADPDPKVTVDD